MFFKRMLKLFIVLLSMIIFFVGNSFAASTIPLDVSECLGVNRQNHPVTSGIPFPKGILISKNNCRVLDPSGKEIPAQTEVLATWDKEGSSIKWLLFDFQTNVGANQKATYYIEYGTEITPGQFTSNLNVNETLNKITVNTGPLQFSINKDRFTFIDEAYLNGTKIIKPLQGQGLSLVDQDGIVYHSSNNGGDYQVIVEDSGPLRAQIKCTGWYVSDSGDKRFQYIVRFNAYAGKPIIRVYHTFVFTEDMFKYRLKNIAIKTPLCLGDNLQYAIGGEDSAFTGTLTPTENIHLLQDDYNHYYIQDNQKNIKSQGTQSKGWVDLNDGQKGVTVFLRDMWQTYPLELEANGKELITHLWPAHGDYTQQVQAKKALASQGKIGHFWPCQEGSELNLTIIDAHAGLTPLTASNAVGISKTHELVYYFHTNNHATAQSENTVKAYGKELMAINPDWTIASKVFRDVHPYDSAQFSKTESTLSRIFDGVITAQKNMIDYGMIHYGDVHYSYTAGSRYWFHFRINWPMVPWLYYARTGDSKYLDFGIAGSRHNMDLDLCHVDAFYTDVNGNNLAKYIGGHFGEDISNAHWSRITHTLSHMEQHPAGMLSYYYFTGYKRAKESAELMGQHIIRMRLNEAQQNGWLMYIGARNTVFLESTAQLYEATWDNRYLILHNAGIEGYKKGITPMGFTVGNYPDIYNYVLFQMAWAPESLERSYRLTNRDDVKQAYLSLARSLGAMGLYEDALGLRNYDYPLDTYAYGYTLSGDEDFMSYGKYHFDRIMADVDDIFAIGRKAPNMHPTTRFLLYMPYLMESLANYTGQINPPLYPPTFINMPYDGSKVSYITKEDNDQKFNVTFGIETDNNYFEAWQTSGNIAATIYDPDGQVVLNEIFTVGHQLTFNPGETAKDDRRLKTFTIPADGKTGNYRIEFSVDKAKHTVCLVKNDLNKTAISLPATGLYLGLGRYYFYVPNGTTSFGIWASDWYLPAIIDPDGNAVTKATITPTAGQTGKLWSFTLKGIYQIKLTGLGDPVTLSFSPQSHFDFVPILSITNTALSDGKVNSSYNVTLSASNGTIPYTWSIISGSLPNGLNLDKNTGKISGTALNSGSFDFTVQVTDSSSPQKTATKDYSITIHPSEVPVINVDTLSLNFGISDTQKLFNISNAGTGTLTWGLNNDRDWITINPIFGNTTTENDSVVVTVNRSGLDIGIYNSTINISSNGGNKNISITMEVPDADIDGLPDSWEWLIIDDDPADSINSIGDVSPDDDYDGDSFTNRQEYASGTNPCNPGDNPGLDFSGNKRIKVICDRWPDGTDMESFTGDAIRIMNAKTNEEKALAIWRFIRMWSTATDGHPPTEPAIGMPYITDALKTLNVYGAHHCDGLSRVMEMAWRSLGNKAEKLYHFGHTMVDCYWKDNDGIERWHFFDTSKGGYVYDRTGQHIATPDEIALDQSLIYRPSRTMIANVGVVPSYVHCQHLPFSSHDMLLSLRQGESLTRLWGNMSLPYQDNFAHYSWAEYDFEHGPYKLTYGNGNLVYTPDFSKGSYKNGLNSPPENLASIADDGQSPNLHPRNLGSAGIAIFNISSPYIIADAWISGNFVRNSVNDYIRFSISTDDGTTWKEVYQAGQTGHYSLNNFNIAEKFSIYQNYPTGLVTPCGHYQYLLKVELEAANNITDCGIEDLTITTITQHNIFSLPQLWPGRNNITISGDIDGDSALRVTYVWDDLMGQGRQNIAIVEHTPYSYEILTSGNKWEDVICKSIIIEAIPRIGNGNFVKEKETAPDVLNNVTQTDAFPTERIIGKYSPGLLKTTEAYIIDLQEGLAAQEGQPTSATIVKDQRNKIRGALFGLSELGRPDLQAKDTIIDVIYEDRSFGFYNKVPACQALYKVAAQDAVQTMIKVLEKDPQIQWGDPAGEFDEATIWLHTCATAAAILADIANTEAKNNVNLITDLLDAKKLETKIGFNPRDIYRYPELRWGWIKALGKLGSPDNQAVITSLKNEIANGNEDSTALAARALGEAGDTTAIPNLLNFLNTHLADKTPYSPQGLYCIESLGKLGDPTIAPQLYSFLDHWDEDYRGFTALALGRLGNTGAIPYLEALLAKETFEWVRKAAQESLLLLGYTQSFTITPDTLPNGIVGAEYNVSLSASGGIEPFIWSIELGGLPAGLHIDSIGEIISGTPINTGSYIFTIKVTDSSSPIKEATKEFTLNTVTAQQKPSPPSKLHVVYPVK